MNKEVLIKKLERKYNGKAVKLDLSSVDSILEEMDEKVEPVLIYKGRGWYRHLYIIKKKDGWKLSPRPYEDLNNVVNKEDLVSKMTKEKRRNYRVAFSDSTPKDVRSIYTLFFFYNTIIIDYLRGPDFNQYIKRELKVDIGNKKWIDYIEEYIEDNKEEAKKDKDIISLLDAYSNNNLRAVDMITNTRKSKTDWLSLIIDAYSYYSEQERNKYIIENIAEGIMEHIQEKQDELLLEQVLKYEDGAYCFIESNDENFENLAYYLIDILENDFYTLEEAKQDLLELDWKEITSYISSAFGI